MVADMSRCWNNPGDLHAGVRNRNLRKGSGWDSLLGKGQ